MENATTNPGSKLHNEWRVKIINKEKTETYELRKWWDVMHFVIDLVIYAAGAPVIIKIQKLDDSDD